MMMIVEGTAGHLGRSMRGRRSTVTTEGADIGLSRRSVTQCLVMRCLVISNPSSNYCFILSVLLHLFFLLKIENFMHYFFYAVDGIEGMRMWFKKGSYAAIFF